MGALAATLVERVRHRRTEVRLDREAREREAERAWLAGQVITAEQEERRRLSLLLHDGVLQSLSGIVLMHDAALKAVRHGNVDEAGSVLESALAREREAIQTLRDLSFALEPVVLRDRGFVAAVDALADQLRAAGAVQVELDVAAGEDLGPKAQVALYQALREALDQAVRRRPRRIAVSVVRGADAGFSIEIADDGVAERRRTTEEAIAERARILNGRVTVIPGAEQGTIVRISLPGYAAKV